MRDTECEVIDVYDCKDRPWRFCLEHTLTREADLTHPEEWDTLCEEAMVVLSSKSGAKIKYIEYYDQKAQELYEQICC